MKTWKGNTSSLLLGNIHGTKGHSIHQLQEFLTLQPALVSQLSLVLFLLGQRSPRLLGPSPLVPSLPSAPATGEWHNWQALHDLLREGYHLNPSHGLWLARKERRYYYEGETIIRDLYVTN